MQTITTSKRLMFGDLGWTILESWLDFGWILAEKTSIIYRNEAVKQHHHLSWGHSRLEPPLKLDIGNLKQNTDVFTNSYWGDFCFPVNNVAMIKSRATQTTSNQWHAPSAAPCVTGPSLSSTSGKWKCMICKSLGGKRHMRENKTMCGVFGLQCQTRIWNVSKPKQVYQSMKFIQTSISQ